MRSLAPFTLATSLLAPLFVAASSTTRNSISALSVVQNATIHTNSHRLTSRSEFELSFNLRDDLYVKFDLEPNLDIFAANAHVSYLAPDGTISSSEPIVQHDHKVYKGTAWVKRPSDGQHKWQRAGWARVGMRKDGKKPVFQGAFSVQRDHYHIQTSSNYLKTKHELDPVVEREDEEFMVVWRNSDVLPTADGLQHQELRRGVDDEMPICGADRLTFNTNPNHPVIRGLMKRTDGHWGSINFSGMFSKRQIDSSTGGNSAGTNLVQNIGQTNGCPSTRKVALVGVATDCTYTADFDSRDEATQNVVDQMNQASGVWEGAFNISLGLQNLTVSDASCPGQPSGLTQWNQACSDSVEIQDRLNMFSAWRGSQADSNSHWTLLSTCNTASAVGLAWLGQACVTTSYTTNSSFTGNGQAGGGGDETVSGANVVIRTNGAAEWQIIAHETGHTYGAVHDCDSTACQDSNYVNSQQCCPLSATVCDAGSQYIMNPSTAQGITEFSLCSIGNICSGIGGNSINTACLSDNRGVETYTGQQCGNGLVEGDEECDCGGEAGCADDPCCDANTCRFASGAVCDDSNDDCCRNCQLASNGTVCRDSTGECDPQEVCSGTSATCPEDVTAPDGQDCGDGVSCASGQCTSRDQQCKSVMGSYTQGNDTYACDHSSCVISCASPEFGLGVCYGLQQNFLDGTTCGGGGRCDNGRCRGASVGGQVKSWIDDHKEVVIGVCASIGALLLISILGCLWRCFKRRRGGGRRKQTMPAPPPGGWQGWSSGPGGPRGSMPPGPPPPPPPQMQQHQSWNNQPWGPPGPNGGGGGWQVPSPPPPTHSSRVVRYG